MPTSRADSGSVAAARIARPMRVKRKKKYSSPSRISVTTNMPAWWSLISWLPRNGAEPNGEGNDLIEKSQIRPALELMIENSAMKPAICTRIEAVASGRNSARSIAMPPMNEMTTESAKATQYGTPHSRSCQAMKVENIAISPCAKFRWSIAS